MFLKWSLLILLTALSAYGDSRGFIYSDRTWNGNSIDWRALIYSYMAYLLGVTAWVFAVKYLKQVGGMGVSAQALGWFLLTMLGVSIASGEFIQWAVLDKILAIVCIACFALLVIRTSTGT